jgi:hypothetical protein
MADEATSDLNVTTDGGIVAQHPAQLVHSVLAAPATASQSNAIVEDLLPVACVRLDNVRFEFDSSFVGVGVATEMRLLATLRKQRPGIVASIFGHADPVGNDDYNKSLSGRRAAAIFALLTRKVEIWEDIFSQKGVFTRPAAGDDWGMRAIQTMLGTITRPPPGVGTFFAAPVSGKLDADTRAALKDFQSANGLPPSGNADAATRAQLFKSYMDVICIDAAGQPFQLDATADFLSRGADPKRQGKGDYQGCSEFNPVLLFSQEENAAFERAADKSARDAENQPNRRVLIFLFRPGLQVTPDAWPCPRANEAPAACRKRFFSDAAQRRSFGTERREYKRTQDTFACRFYDRLARPSPCENPGLGPLEVKAFVGPGIERSEDVQLIVLDSKGNESRVAATQASGGDAGFVIFTLNPPNLPNPVELRCQLPLETIHIAGPCDPSALRDALVVDDVDTGGRLVDNEAPKEPTTVASAQALNDPEFEDFDPDSLFDERDEFDRSVS